MKVVALVSGGKDSCYAMMECVRYGHEVVCLAHLHPPSELSADAAEIDSFMFQSVGHNVVGMVAEAMALPLVTGAITGTALKTGIDYHTTTAGDEVEDLYRLLERVLQQFPDVQGVCTGAIFSSYQRNRVENVCSRLGLTSLGYLWRRDQASLLQEMIDSEVEAILVKVASIGLTPRKHLGKTIAELQPELMALKDKFKLNVCGEGGEYETLTLDCPLFKKRIVIDSSRTVLHSDDYFAPVAFLAIEQCHLEDKAPPDPSLLASKLPGPELLAPSPLPAIAEPANGPKRLMATALARVPKSARSFVPSFGKFRDQFHMTGVMSPRVGEEELSLEDEVTSAFKHSHELLAAEGLTVDDLCFVHVYVQDMAIFKQLNEEYCRYLGQNLPPSRSCVELKALKYVPARILLDGFALRGSGTQKLMAQRVRRDVLHVKSISTWAPCCIGPYSQANVLHCALILLAGQISLLPQTMELVGVNHAAQAKQCLRNAGCALEALTSNLRHVCSGIIYTTNNVNDGQAREELLTLVRRELELNGERVDEYENPEDSAESGEESDEDVEKQERCMALVKHTPLLAVQVSGLPRNALVEVELQALTHVAFQYLSPRSGASTTRLGELRVDTQHCIIPRALCQLICMATAPETSSDGHIAVKPVAAGIWKCALETLVEGLMPWDRVLHVRIFYLPWAFASELELGQACRDAVTKHAKAARLPAMTFVPVDGIQGDAQIALQVTAQDLDKLDTELWLHKQI